MSPLVDRGVGRPLGSVNHQLGPDRYRAPVADRLLGLPKRARAAERRADRRVDLMRTKLVVLMLSSAALVASAVPTPSSAQQFQEGGVSLAVGAKFTATSLETQTTTSVGTLDCSKVTLHMTVMANGTTTSRATSDSIDT